MPFVIPRMRDARPEWQIRLALLLYDHLGDRGGMAKSRTIRLRQDRAGRGLDPGIFKGRSEEHTSELQSLMRISYAVFCLKKKKKEKQTTKQQKKISHTHQHIYYRKQVKQKNT